MKILLYLISIFNFTLICCNSLYSQNTFLYSVKDTISDDYLLYSIELTNNDIILAGGKQIYDSGFNIISKDILLIKLTSKGKQTRIRTINFENKHSEINYIFQLNQNFLLLVGIVNEDTSSSILIIQIDTSFNIIKSKVIPTGNYNPLSVNFLPEYDGSYLLYGFVSKTLSTFITYPYIYKISNNLDSLHLKIFDHSGYGWSSLLKINDHSGYNFFVTGYSYLSSEQILQIDTSFDILKIDSVPRELYNMCNTQWINQTEFILTGEKLFNSSSINYIGVLILDTSFAVIHENYFGNPDTISFPGMNKNLDFLFSDKIYIGGTFNFGYGSAFASVNSWFFLNQIDTVCSINWQKYFGGDYNYTLWGVMATKDGGCLMYGTKYDWQKKDYQRDIYIIKVNKDGLLLSADGTNSEKLKEVILFPNPAIDKIYVRSALRGLILSIFDRNGRSIMNEKIQSMTDQFDISFLASGIYYYRFTKDGKFIDSGKLIKQ